MPTASIRGPSPPPPLDLPAQGIPPTAAQSASAVAKIMGVTDEWMSVFLSTGPGQPHSNGLSDIVSKGYEVEMTYNPTRNWRIEFTGAQQIAIDTAIGPEQFNDSRERLPVSTGARDDCLPGNGDDCGASYWTTIPVLGGGTPETTYCNGLIPPTSSAPPTSAIPARRSANIAGPS